MYLLVLKHAWLLRFLSSMFAIFNHFNHTKSPHRCLYPSRSLNMVFLSHHFQYDNHQEWPAEQKARGWGWGGMETGSGGIWWLDPRKSNNGFGRKLRCRCLKTNFKNAQKLGIEAEFLIGRAVLFSFLWSWWIWVDMGLASAIEMVRLKMFQHRYRQNSWGCKLPRNRTGTEWCLLFQ